MVAALVGMILLGTAALSRRNQQLIRQSALLAATLDSMHHGLMLLDHDGRIAVYNRQAMQLLDLPEPFLSTHPSSEDVLAYQTQRNEFSNAPATVMVRLQPRPNIASEYAYERTRPNGTILEVRTVPFADGIVRAYRDITDRKRIERELSRRVKQFRLLAGRIEYRFRHKAGHWIWL